MKLNMGCGHNRLTGYVNVDSAAACAPDEVWDLEQTPWPWPDGSARDVMFIHSLEHMGADPKVFLAMIRELYRIAAPGCRVRIHAPHPRHDDFINDPTHVRAITPSMLRLFDKTLNDKWQAEGAANTPLAHYLGVDFTLQSIKTVLDEPWASQLKDGAIAAADVTAAMRSSLNVAREFQIVMAARKPA